MFDRAGYFTFFGPNLKPISGGLELSEPENGLEPMQKNMSMPKALPVLSQLSELPPSTENTVPKGIAP